MLFTLLGATHISLHDYEKADITKHKVSISTAIQHIVVIVQENRTLNNLFMGFPGAVTSTYGYTTGHVQVPLQSTVLETTWDMEHAKIPDWNSAYDGGLNDGWNSENALHCPCPANPAYSYVNQAEVQPYWYLAEQWALGDEMFETGQGPSFPAHQYIVRGASTPTDGSAYKAAENPTNNAGGCDSPGGTTVALIDSSGVEGTSTAPCFTVTSIFTELDNASINWNDYFACTEGPNNNSGFWKPVDALHDIWLKSAEFNLHVICPPSTILTDIGNGNLAKFTLVTPTGNASDHATETDGSGPSWVSSVVNAVGQSKFWNNCVIIVVWDDWGGWYDPIVPTVRNSYELGYRVPMIVIGPYVKQGYVSHVPYEFGSILKLTEEAFSLPSIGTTDSGANDLSDFFDFDQAPNPYFPVVGIAPNIFFQNDPGSFKGAPDE